MRILLVEGAHELGGQARHVYDLAKGLAERGYEITVACARQEAIFRLEKVGIPCVKLPFGWPLDPLSTASLVRLIRTSRYDIVHSHGVRAGLQARTAARFAGGCRVVHTIHNMAEDVAPGHGLCGMAARRVYRSVDSWLGNNTDRIITVSEELRRRTVCKIIPPNKVVTIHSGLDLAEYERPVSATEGRRRLGLPLGCKVVGTVARFTKQKSFDDLLHAARIVCGEREDVCFVLVGDGPDHVRIKQMAQELGIGHKVFFPGYVNGTAKILPGFDVFALSSLWEGHPLSVLEAMAAGLSVVATRVNGITETVLHGETGYIVPVGDPGSMAERLLEVLIDDNLASKMGEAGRQRVLEQFSLERMLNFTESVYRDALGRRQLSEPIGAIG